SRLLAAFVIPTDQISSYKSFLEIDNKYITPPSIVYFYSILLKFSVNLTLVKAHAFSSMSSLSIHIIFLLLSQSQTYIQLLTVFHESLSFQPSASQVNRHTPQVSAVSLLKILSFLQSAV